MFQRKIHYFIAVVEDGTFSAAAKRFYLSQAAISQQITQLENELNITLFDRSQYRPVLTKVGKYYYEECKKLILLYNKIEINTRTIDKSNTGLIRVGITGPFEHNHIPYIVEEFKKEHSDITVEFHKNSFQDCVSLLEEEMLDIAFGIENDFEGRSNIQYITLLKQRICVICSKKHPWAQKKSIDSLELADEPIISLSKKFRRQFYRDFMRAFEKDGVKPNIVKEVDQLDELILAVKLNEGIALTSREVIQENEVIMLDIINTHHHANFCVGYLKNNDKEYVHSFIQKTEQYFGNYEFAGC